MSRPKFYSAIFLFLVCHWLTADGYAQMFGNRRVGEPLGRRAGPQSQAGAANQGTLQGSERFLRDNRGANQFVGSDTRDAASFVGQINAGEQTNNVAPAIEGVNRPDLSNMINRPARPRRPNGPLDPPLSLGFRLEPETIARHVEKAQTSIGRSLSVPFETQIEVLVVNQTAILRGEVRDAEQSRLAEIIAQMEPGIAEVQNELTIRQPLPNEHR